MDYKEYKRKIKLFKLLDVKMPDELKKLSSLLDEVFSLKNYKRNFNAYRNEYHFKRDDYEIYLVVDSKDLVKRITFDYVVLDRDLVKFIILIGDSYIFCNEAVKDKLIDVYINNEVSKFI